MRISSSTGITRVAVPPVATLGGAFPGVAFPRVALTVAVLIVAVILGFGSSLSAQKRITVELDLDTATWAPVAYLSLIPDFTQLHTISYDHIIGRSPDKGNGTYEFPTGYLPEGDHLYRIHFSKKGDPPASLIIGGKEHNHFFLFAARGSNVSVRTKKGERLLNDISFEGSGSNKALQELDDRLQRLDSMDQLGDRMNREYARNALYGETRAYADTCSHPLVSLYALYQIDYMKDREAHPGFYRDYLRKWRPERSAYFKEFRSSLRRETHHERVVAVIAGSGLVMLLSFALLLYHRSRKQRKSSLSGLTIQERKVFDLLKQGKSNKEIAGECAVSVSTVKSHVNSIFSKLSIRSRKEIMDMDT